LVEKDDPLGTRTHPVDRILTAAVHPIGVHLELDQRGGRCSRE
jgi:hypothetical protein